MNIYIFIYYVYTIFIICICIWRYILKTNFIIFFMVPVLTSLKVAALCVFKQSFSAGWVRSLSDRSSPIAEAIEFACASLKNLSPPSTTIETKKQKQQSLKIRITVSVCVESHSVSDFFYRITFENGNQKNRLG